MNALTKISIISVSVILGVVLTVKFLFPYLTPFLFAILLAAVIDPLIDWLEEEAGFRRGFAVLLVLLVVLVILIVLITLLVTNVTTELNILLQNISQLNTSWNQLIEEILSRVERFSAGLAELPAPWNSILGANANQVGKSIETVAKTILGLLGGVPQLLFNLVIASIATFFISRDKSVFFNYLLGLVPRRWRQSVLRLKTEVAAGLIGFLRSQMILISITGVLALAGLIILKVRYAWLLGILAGFLDLIPMIGPSGVFIPMIAYNAITGNLVRTVSLAMVLGLILVVRQLSEPRVVGSHIGLHPLTSLIAIYLGSKLLGVNGFIIGPLVMIFLKAVMIVVILPMLPEE